METNKRKENVTDKWAMVCGSELASQSVDRESQQQIVMMAVGGEEIKKEKKKNVMDVFKFYFDGWKKKKKWVEHDGTLGLT